MRCKGRVITSTMLSMYNKTNIKNLSFKIGVSNEYNSKVAVGRKHMDTTYFGKLVYTWE